MTTLEIWLLAISLAMDCFTVSITSGIIMRRICWRTFFIMAFFFGLFQAVMPLIGWGGARRVYPPTFFMGLPPLLAAVSPPADSVT